MFTFEAHKRGMNSGCMTFIPGDVPTLATLGEDGVRVWDLRERKAIRHLRSASGDEASSLTCSADGRLLVVCTGSGPSRIRLWGWAARRVEKVVECGDKAQCAVLSPDGSSLAMGGYRDPRVGFDYAARPLPSAGPGCFDIRRVRTATWAPLRLLAGHEDQIGFLAFSPDGRLLASASADRRAILWDLATREKLAIITHEAEVRGVAFSPDGAILATTGGRSVKLFDVARLKPIRRQLSGHKKEVRGIAFSPDGATLASVALDGLVRLWDLKSGKPGRVFDWGLGRLCCVASAPDGMLAAAAAADGRVVIWDRDD